ncbi:hypothetical protein CPB86DRAFT_633498 [Serendipita vermifera]|nr:hypothetical protein CPB86DRAFT_633498 [Serendipita vermifera]
MRSRNMQGLQPILQPMPSLKKCESDAQSMELCQLSPVSTGLNVYWKNYDLFKTLIAALTVLLNAYHFSVTYINIGYCKHHKNL